ncbi:MAG: hypothetical protein AAFY34_05165 [Pseudomonadota bacterium]
MELEDGGGLQQGGQVDPKTDTRVWILAKDHPGYKDIDYAADGHCGSPPLELRSPLGSWAGIIVRAFDRHHAAPVEDGVTPGLRGAGVCASSIALNGWNPSRNAVNVFRDARMGEE